MLLEISFRKKLNVPDACTAILPDNWPWVTWYVYYLYYVYRYMFNRHSSPPVTSTQATRVWNSLFDSRLFDSVLYFLPIKIIYTLLDGTNPLHPKVLDRFVSFPITDENAYYWYLYLSRIDIKKVWQILAQPNSELAYWQASYCQVIKDRKEIWKALAKEGYDAAMCQYRYYKYVSDRPEMIEAIIRSKHPHAAALCYKQLHVKDDRLRQIVMDAKLPNITVVEDKETAIRVYAIIRGKLLFWNELSRQECRSIISWLIRVRYEQLPILQKVDIQDLKRSIIKITYPSIDPKYLTDDEATEVLRMVLAKLEKGG